METEENWNEFVAFHRPELAKDEVKHGILLDILSSGEQDGRRIRCWSLDDRPGSCAVMTIGHNQVHWSIILGDLNKNECRHLAEITVKLPYPGVMGADLTALWFAGRAAELGIAFPHVEPQQIYWLSKSPIIDPLVPGHVEPVTLGSTVFPYWLALFAAESSPHEPRPTYQDAIYTEDALRIEGECRYFFWIVDGEPVSMAGIVRRLSTTAAVTGVYTPVEHRGKGYAGAVTAAVTHLIHRECRTATLYTDIRNPAPNRCYRRLGFEPVHTSLHFHR
jgi:acetyltransferase (GNAT) family protein